MALATGLPPVAAPDRVGQFKKAVTFNVFMASIFLPGSTG
jgi:hypothetical protein